MSRITALALLLLIAAPSHAHDTWLLPAQGAPDRLQLTSGMQFPQPDYAPRADRVERAWGGAEGRVAPLPKPKRGAQALEFRVSASSAPAAWAVQLRPRTLVMDQAEIGHYLDEIHAAPELRARWQQQPAPRRWNEEYRKHAKALSHGVADHCPTLAAQPLGLGLELLIDADVCALRAGATLPLRALDAGAPKPGLVIALVGTGGREVAHAATDAEGRARLSLPSAGRWLLRATDLRPASADRPELDWQSDFTTLTFEIP